MTAWVLFTVGVILFTADWVDLNPSGLALLAVVLWVLAGWLGGVFTRNFWIQDITDTHPDALGSLDQAERAAINKAIEASIHAVRDETKEQTRNDHHHP